LWGRPQALFGSTLFCQEFKILLLLEDVRKNFRSADQIGDALVFDIAWNNLRLITTVEYPTKRIFVKALMSHKEYDRKEWMKWAKR
jgi:mRNA-degrading endonuclease HigB of HigAB toxin-antitoxin module